jgi:hypothetical protein
MKIILEFDSLDEADKALNGAKYLVCLQRIDGFLRSQEKWNENLTHKEAEYIGMIRSQLFNICSEEGVELYE